MQSGLVDSLHRPGGNVTGVTDLGIEVSPKQLELLRQVIPDASAAAMLVNPANSLLGDLRQRTVQAAANELGLKLHILEAGDDAELDAAFAALARLRAGGLVIATDLFFSTPIDRLAALARRHAMPAITAYPEFARAGGLLSYGGGIIESSRLAGVYTGRILKGEKPSLLPVLQVSKLELIVNLATAQAIGIDIPGILLAQADEVIE